MTKFEDCWDIWVIESTIDFCLEEKFPDGSAISAIRILFLLTAQHRGIDQSSRLQLLDRNRAIEHPLGCNVNVPKTPFAHLGLQQIIGCVVVGFVVRITLKRYRTLVDPLKNGFR